MTNQNSSHFHKLAALLVGKGVRLESWKWVNPHSKYSFWKLTLCPFIWATVHGKKFIISTNITKQSSYFHRKSTRGNSNGNGVRWCLPCVSIFISSTVSESLNSALSFELLLMAKNSLLHFWKTNEVQILLKKGTRFVWNVFVGGQQHDWFSLWAQILEAYDLTFQFM